MNTFNNITFMADIQQFEKLWDGFVTSFKGDLIGQSRKQTLTYPLVKLIFSDKVLTLTSEYGSFGRWLDEVIRNQPRKGKLIKELLTKDMVLTEERLNNEISSGMKYVAVGGAGALGFIAAKGMALGMLSTAVLTLAPMAIVYPVATSYISTHKEKNIYTLIDAYITQLDKYKKSISSVLLAEE
ncbi:hypothetical protein [Bacteroides oleiciplenus]|nr:hypothetical protein [Bacteroides oleiciplenus]RGN40159.1 hypothetical protein DXB65_00470 [Bacteroides oleiciplenus]